MRAFKYAPSTLNLRFYKSLWGMESMPLPEALALLDEAGYEGVETPLPGVRQIRELGDGRPAIAMLFVEDVETLRRNLDDAGELGVEAVNVHAGKDWWDFQHGCMFFESALEAVRESGLPVTFETHRGRLLFEPQSTAAYLRKFEQLRLTADFSHWTCVCESLLADQADAVELAVSRTSLVHARVGHEEGPQVPDPRSPRWTAYVERFEAWWDAIRDAHLARGESVLRIDPEFGPPNYLWTDPEDGRPLADLFEVCRWMRDRLRNRWS